MKKRTFPITAITLIIVGAIFLLSSFSGITGFVVLKDVGKSVSGVLGLVFVVVGVVLLMAGRRITPKKDLEYLTTQQKAVRRKLANLLAGKPNRGGNYNDWQKIGIALPRYDKALVTHDRVKGSKVFIGHIGNREEYFTVDMSSKHQKILTLGDDKKKFKFPVPTHIDIQVRDHNGRYHQQLDNKGKPVKYPIDWNGILKSAKVDDIEDYFSRA